MKNLLFASALLLASTAIASAQESPTTQPGQNQQPQQTQQPGQDYRTDPATPQDPTIGQDQQMPTGKETISAEELPQTITQQLQGQDYSGWTIQEATKRMRGDEAIYEVELTSGDQLKKMKFDHQGNVLKEKTKRNKG